MTVDVFTDDIGQPVFPSRFVNGNDPRMSKLCSTARLAKKTLFFLTSRENAPGYLQRDRAVQLGIVCLVDVTKSTGAK